MPPSDYKSPLQTAQGVSLAGYTNPALQQQGALMPQLVQAAKAYPGALQAALESQNKSYDRSEGVLNDYNATISQPGKDDTWGRFGVGLMQNTTTGNFGEGLANAFGSAMDARSAYRDKESQRQEKLMRSKIALEELRLNRPNSQVAQMENTLKAYEVSGKVGGMQADYEIGNGLTPQGDEALLADYAKNPMKYQGQLGQQKIADAQERASAAAKQADERQWWVKQQDYQSQLKREEEAAKANQPPNLTSVDKKAFLDAKGTKSNMIYALSNLDKAMELGPQSLTGPATGLRATVGDWLGDEQSAAHLQYQQIMEGEAIKQMAETLKGATTDREMQKFIDIVADPGASWAVKKPAIERVKAFVEMQIAESEDTMRGIGNGKLYQGGGQEDPGQGEAQPPPKPTDVVGTDASGNNILWEDIVHTAEQNGMTVEEVIKKLNGE